MDGMALGTDNDLQNVEILILVTNLSKKRASLPKGILINIGFDLPEVALHLDQATVILLKRREGNKSAPSKDTVSAVN